jgi:hypothetical protein
MKILRGILALAIVLSLSFTATCQEKGYWRAASTTAKGITGDVAFSADKMSINFASFTIANIRDLTPDEIAAAFDGASGGAGTLYRLSIPGDKKFLHKNTLCGTEETQWVVTYAAGKNLQLIFYSGSAMPKLTIDGMANNTDLCGTYSYVR